MSLTNVTEINQRDLSLQSAGNERVMVLYLQKKDRIYHYGRDIAKIIAIR